METGSQWCISKLKDFDFEIVYIPGKSNAVADALSRKINALTQDDEVIVIDEDESNYFFFLNPFNPLLKLIFKHSKKNPT